jgi:hypothetical protein
MVTKAKKKPTKASKAKPKATTKKKPSRKPATKPVFEEEPATVDPDEMERALTMIADACEMMGWNMAIGCSDTDAIVGVCAGEDNYMQDMIGEIPPKES